MGFGQQMPQGHHRLWTSRTLDQSLVLTTTCLTLFKLFFTNDVKHVKCRIGFGQQMPQGHNRLWTSRTFDQSLVLNTHV